MSAGAQRLAQRIKDGRVVVVVGAGVSIGATLQADGTPHPNASWPGLLASGIQEMQQRELDAEDIAYARSLLAKKRYEKAAGLVVEGLANFFGDWLQSCFGQEEFRVTHRDVPEALHQLGRPILTTNFDAVLETVTSRRPLDWRSAEGWKQAVDHPDQYVLHIHGTYTDSASVVLTDDQYRRLLEDSASQALWRSVASQYSLLFVGLGAGLEDPNFARLRSYLADVLGQAGQEHFRLVHADEDDPATRDELFGEKITQVSYGASPADLAPFLARLAPVAPEAAAVTPSPRPAVLVVDVDQDRVRATLRNGEQAPQTRGGECGLTQVVLETLSLLDEWIRGESDGDERAALRQRVAQQTGRVLFDAVFRGDVLKLYGEGLAYEENLRKQLASADRLAEWPPMEIVLRIKKELIQLYRPINQIALDDLPWELLLDPSNGHLSAWNMVTLVRGPERQPGQLQPRVWEPLEELNVLVALVQPTELVRQVGQGYDGVIAGIRAAIGASAPSKSGPDVGPPAAVRPPPSAAPGEGRIHVFELDRPEDDPGGVRRKVTWARFMAAFGTGEASTAPARRMDVVHFIGHAGMAGVGGLGRYVAFETDDDDGTDWVSFDEIDEFFRGLDDNARPTVMMLHLCRGPEGGITGPSGPLDLTRASFSQLGYLLIKAQIPMVVAMQYPLRPDTGSMFSSVFYQRVTTMPVAQAVQAARVAVWRGSGTAGRGPVCPVLFMGGDMCNILTQAQRRPAGDAAEARGSTGGGITRLVGPSPTARLPHGSVTSAGSGAAPDSFRSGSSAGGESDAR